MAKSPNQKLKLGETAQILAAIGFQMDRMSPRRRERICMALLAAAGLTPGSDWADSKHWEGEGSWSLRSREVLAFWNEHYGENLASSSYDDVVRKDLVHLIEAGVVEAAAGQPEANQNTPTRSYAVRPAASGLLNRFGEDDWENEVRDFVERHGLYGEKLYRPREKKGTQVRFPDGQTVQLADGPHNELQRRIVEDFLPQFASAPEILYLADSDDKSLHFDREALQELGFALTDDHETLPDVLAYDRKNNWLFVIEAAHSSNPITQVRHLALERMASNCSVPVVYVTAFGDRAKLREFLGEISWETEVWLAEDPTHLIHFDGDKFLGPHDS